MTTLSAERQANPPVTGKPAAHAGRAAHLDLIGALCDPDTSIAEIQLILETRPGLSDRILNAGGAGAASGLCRPITSIRQAVVLLGRRRLQGWILLTLLSANLSTPTEQLVVALTRARTCELLVTETARDDLDAAFTVGLLSGLGPVFGMPLPTLIAQLRIKTDLAAAVTDHTGSLGAVLADVLGWEARTADDLAPAHDQSTTHDAYTEAARWATDLAALVDECSSQRAAG